MATFMIKCVTYITYKTYIRIELLTEFEVLYASDILINICHYCSVMQ